MPVEIPKLEMNDYDYGGPKRHNYIQNGYELYPQEDPYRRTDPYIDPPYRVDEFYREDEHTEDLYRKVNKTGYHGQNPYPGDMLGDQGNFDRSSNPSFEVDHLATFAANRADNLQQESGLAKLQTMENTSGIWTMRCMLIVERNHLVVIEKGTGSELERFSLSMVQDPMAVTKPDRREIYNNLVLFIEEDQRKPNAQVDMHIFQSVLAPAQDIVDEIFAAKGGHGPLHRNNARIPPPPNQPAPEPPGYVRDQIYQFNQGREDRPFGGGGAPMPFNPPFVRDREETDSVLSEKTERDVQLLNHCFDDVEKFVSRLQRAAESYKELERLKREKKQKGKRGLPDHEERLNISARPPAPPDFVDIFQKFKLSFNLLAKLKAHIHDPNAPELVHFLFTPLSLIYEASRDPTHGTHDLAAQVYSPLLSREAKELLLNCLTSKETDLWMSLGEAWTTSRDQWKGYLNSYTPIFYDGWQPAPSLVDDTVAPNPPFPAPIQPIRNPMEEVKPPRVMPRPSPGPYRPEPDRLESPRTAHQPAEYNSHIEMIKKPQAGPLEDSFQAFIRDLKSRGAKMFEATHDRTSRNAKELTVSKGDILEVLDDSRNWWKLKNYRGEIGHAPYTILKSYDGEKEHSNEYGAHIPAGNGAGHRGRMGEFKYF